MHLRKKAVHWSEIVPSFCFPETPTGLMTSIMVAYVTTLTMFGTFRKDLNKHIVRLKPDQNQLFWFANLENLTSAFARTSF